MYITVYSSSLVGMCWERANVLVSRMSYAALCAFLFRASGGVWSAIASIHVNGYLFQIREG